MSRTAKVFMTNRSQAVRLPKEFQFATDEVLIRKVGDDVLLSPRPRDWKTYLVLVHPNAVLAFSISGEGLQTIARHGSHLVESLSAVEHRQLSVHDRP